MISFLDGGLLRQIQAIFTCYLGSLLTGFSVAFSAIAIPGIKLDRAQQLSFVGSIEVSDDNLSWFGKLFNNIPGDLFISCLPASIVAIGILPSDNWNNYCWSWMRFYNCKCFITCSSVQ